MAGIKNKCEFVDLYVNDFLSFLYSLKKKKKKRRKEICNQYEAYKVNFYNACVRYDVVD